VPVWKTLPLEVQPSLTLCSWQVMKLPEGTLHLVGYCIENREGRVSGEVRAFDKQRLCATTKSGRVYRLQGSPGCDSDAEYVWDRWVLVNALTEWVDIAPSLWHDSLRGCASTRDVLSSALGGEGATS
jgi:hypothetical protein